MSGKLVKQEKEIQHYCRPGGRGTDNMRHQLLTAKINFREVFDNGDLLLYTIYS
jgi:hypothetical protein